MYGELQRSESQEQRDRQESKRDELARAAEGRQYQQQVQQQEQQRRQQGATVDNPIAAGTAAGGGGGAGGTALGRTDSASERAQEVAESWSNSFARSENEGNRLQQQHIQQQQQQQLQQQQQQQIQQQQQQAQEVAANRMLKFAINQNQADGKQIFEAEGREEKVKKLALEDECNGRKGQGFCESDDQCSWEPGCLSCLRPSSGKCVLRSGYKP